MTSRSIVAPAEIFRRFCEHYRGVRPRQRISVEFETILNGVIDDICAGSEIGAFLEGNPFLDVEPATDSDLKCSKALLFFFEFLCTAMHEQGVFHLTPTRATEMLYNLGWDSEEPGQTALTLKPEPHQNLYFLVSTAKYERRAGVKLCLTLGTLNDCTDWTPLLQGWDNLHPSLHLAEADNDDNDDNDRDDADPDDHGSELPSALYG